jgi:hypothetical protein
MLLCYFIPFFITFFVYIDGPCIVVNSIKEKYKKLNKITRLVRTNYKGIYMITWITFTLIVKACWISLLQKIYGTICQLKEGQYIMSYVIEGNTYKMVIKPKRGPKKVLMVIDKDNNDISSILSPFLGPRENFHGHDFTPKFFSYKEIIFILSNGSELTFTENDIINLNACK